MPDLTPTPRHMALAAEAVTGGPPHERDLVLRVAAAIAAEAEAARLAGWTAGFDAAQAQEDERRGADRDRALLAATARSDPRLASFAAELRSRGWRPRTVYGCGCGPEALCPAHTALRDAEAATVTAV